ncbi:MAG: L,D-transpeptidase family protein [Pseudomonadota bacterium]
MRRSIVVWMIFGALIAGIGGSIAGARQGDLLRRPPLLVPVTQQADRILVEKGERRMRLFRGEREIARYAIGLGFSPEGDKEREGDGRTPEGVYRIDWRNPESAYHLSLRVSYPDAQDLAEAAARGDNPGGDIFIHGVPNNTAAHLAAQLKGHDWTAGCISVSNEEIREIWSLVPDGAVIEILP